MVLETAVTQVTYTEPYSFYSIKGEKVTGLVCRADAYPLLQYRVDYHDETADADCMMVVQSKVDSVSH